MSNRYPSRSSRRIVESDDEDLSEQDKRNQKPKVKEEVKVQRKRDQVSFY